MAICLFSYLGVETAAVAAAKVRDPERNVPKSTIYGTLASAAVYLLSMIAVFGILPAAALAEDANKASYSAAANAIVRWHLGRQPRGACRHHLRHRRAQRLDDDLRGDAARRRQGRPLPASGSDSLSGRDVPAFGIIASTVARLGGGGHQLHGRQRRHGLHHPGADDGHHRGDPLRVLGAGPAQVAPARQPHRRTRRGSCGTSRWRSSRSSSRSRSSTTRATPATTGTSSGDRS